MNSNEFTDDDINSNSKDNNDNEYSMNDTMKNGDEEFEFNCKTKLLNFSSSFLKCCFRSLLISRISIYISL